VDVIVPEILIVLNNNTIAVFVKKDYFSVKQGLFRTFALGHTSQVAELALNLCV